jgi:hypothetical protein
MVDDVFLIGMRRAILLGAALGGAIREQTGEDWANGRSEQLPFQFERQVAESALPLDL